MQVALLGAEADPEPAKTPAATKAMPHTENRLCRMTPPLRLVLDHRSLRLVPSSPPEQPSSCLDSGGPYRRVHQCRLTVDVSFSFETHPDLHGHFDGSLVSRIDQTDQA